MKIIKTIPFVFLAILFFNIQSSCVKKETPVAPVFFDTTGRVILPLPTASTDTLWEPNLSGGSGGGTTTGGTNQTVSLKVTTVLDSNSVIVSGVSIDGNSDENLFNQLNYSLQEVSDNKGERVINNVKPNTKYFFRAHKYLGSGSDSLIGYGDITTSSQGVNNLTIKLFPF